MALSANKSREINDMESLKQRSFYVVSAAEIYEGACITVNTSGYAKEAAAGEQPVGIAQNYVKNASATAVTSTADGMVTVNYGHIETFANTNAAVSQINDAVYALADDTVSITSSTSGIPIGYIIDLTLSTEYKVRILPNLT